ncbi:PilZ domain-containing protein [Geothrix sp. PMB-07]|uniref:PilZ domain-containing protein n=1 Tax=Geothrix sp. PMB-07 TaxID=3068640 RepID=UPI002740982C|nr:PilZ domain-containing protein [Geothrix sp. PMB-07]WLT32779.1 PilZ domain-containing protein [Geothrix sp. PMB-07]
MAGTLIRNADTIADIFKRACERRELMILVTPYLRFESSFIKMDGSEVQVVATMGREDATYGLRNSALKMRFPHGVSFLEAPTELKGFGMHDGRRTLRLALPMALHEEDHRGSYRVDRVGRVPVTFSTPDFDLVMGTLVDISTTGGRIYSTRDFMEGELEPGQDMAVTIPLTEQIRINTRVKLRHVHGRTFGVEFRPQLDESILNPLSRWVFEKREEDLDRISRRGVDTASPAGPIGRVATGRPSGLLLVSAESALEATLQDLLGGLQPLTRIPPTMAALKEALNLKPALVLYHVPSLSLDEKRRLRPMVECIQGRAPLLLLGTGLEGGALLELGNELKATVSIIFNPERGVFFQRLVQGVLRRTYEGGESPMAPQEPEGD